jgi:DNA-binding IclR family transcriptional regulator
VARPTSKSDIYYIEVLGKGLDILDVFVRVQKPRLTLQEISTLSRLNKNTVFRVLYTLAEHGYVVKRQHDYELGTKVLDLSETKLRRRDLLGAAGPSLDALRRQFQETLNLGVLDGGQIRYVDVRESPYPFRLAERIGGSDYLHCTALGKCHLAFLPFEHVRQLMKEQGMPRQTARTIVTLTALKAELERVRQQGYALDPQESMDGAFCLGVPILDDKGSPIAAISISGPVTRFNPSVVPAASDAMLRAAQEIRAKLGYGRTARA